METLTWMHGRWRRILLVSPTRYTKSFATFWSACSKRTCWRGVRAARAEGCPGDPCGETGTRAQGWTARSSLCGRRWVPQTLRAGHRREPGAPAFWCHRCLTGFLTSWSLHGHELALLTGWPEGAHGKVLTDPLSGSYWLPSVPKLLATGKTAFLLDLKKLSVN